MQVIYLCSVVFGLFIAPVEVILPAYVVMQLSELHALIVFRALLAAAHNPDDDLKRFQRPVAYYEIGSALAVGLVLLLAYLATRDEWTMGVLALSGLGAIYFVHGNKHDAFTLYGSIGLIAAVMAFGVVLRA